MRCDVCNGHVGVELISDVMEEVVSAGVHRMCASCNVKAARKLKKFKDVPEDDRKRLFVRHLKSERSKL